MTHDRPGVLGTIGSTPILRLDRLVEPGMAEVWVKLEAENPTGSVLAGGSPACSSTAG
ncbi:MAG TPA: hypothetical protein VH813_05920 [Candidatus Limnocylindrales bacterium]|jgi:cysteine synthase